MTNGSTYTFNPFATTIFCPKIEMSQNYAKAIQLAGFDPAKLVKPK
jgi:hypothetical protein